MIKPVRSQVCLKTEIGDILRAIAMSGGSIANHMDVRERIMHPNEVEMYARGFADAITAVSIALHVNQEET